MKLYIKKTSSHPTQKRFENFSTSKKLLLSFSSLILGICGFIISIYSFFPAAYSIFQLLTGANVVNVNYVGLVCGAGLFLCPFIILTGYTSAIHKRVIIPSEMTHSAKETIYWLFKLVFIFMVPVPIILSALSYAFIEMHDYSWCPQMSAGSGWDSYWVIDSSYCTSR